MRLTQHFAVLILLVEVREGGENEAESGDHHKHAGDNGNHLAWEIISNRDGSNRCKEGLTRPVGLH